MFAFQPTCPRGARHCHPGMINLTSISIHVPTRGTTIPGSRAMFAAKFQSTCPRGARHALNDRASYQQHFNPRAHEGHDITLDLCCSYVVISIHVPTRGTTLKLIISLFFYKYFLYVVPKFMIYLKFGSSASSRTRPFTMNTALESGRSRTSREIDVHSHFA